MNPPISEQICEDNNVRPIKKDQKLFLGLKPDDILLAALILIILQKEEDDKILLIALAYLFISEYIDLDKIGGKFGSLFKSKPTNDNQSLQA